MGSSRGERAGPFPTTGVAEPPSELFGAPLSLSPWISRGGARVTACWVHGPFCGGMPALGSHMVSAIHAGSGSVAGVAGGRRNIGWLRRGTVIVLPQGACGHWDFRGQVECSQVFLPLAMVQRRQNEIAPGQPAGLRASVAVRDPVLFPLMEMLAAEAQTPGAAASLFREQCLELLCTQLARQHARVDAAPTPETPGGLAGWQLRRVTDYMRENLQAPLTLEQLALQVGLSRHYLCTAFRRATGSTPYAYLTWIRISRAKELLADPAMPIGAIARAVGYCSPSSFAATFRRATGVSPRAFRHRS